MSGNVRLAILGGSECGKSTLASGYVRGQWRFERRRGIVFDPWIADEKPIDWGPGAWKTGAFDRWRRSVMTGPRGCVAVWDEGTSYGGRDRENVELFSAIRHRHPFMIFLGHRFDTMLPVMRACLTHVALAKCNPVDAKEWAEHFADDQVMRATELDQYEFLIKRPFNPVRIVRYTPAEIAAGLWL